MTVYLVGAGPGDPGLLTVRGAELLRRAEVVVHDRLSAPELLDLVPLDAERIDVGKSPGRHRVPQADINALLVERGLRGQEVVRLKGGDPFVFARGSEEAAALIEAGVAYEVVPGVTSALAVPAAAGIPVTQRFSSTSFTVVTGHEDPSSGDGSVDWDAVGRTGGTLIILMGVARWPHIAARLLGAGRDPDTPAAAVRWGTRPNQTTVRATLATLEHQELASPAVIVVGAVAAERLTWFEDRPLFGRTVVVTRARAAASGLAAKLRELGADVVEAPAIEVAAPLDGGAGLDAALAQPEDLAWLVLTSPNGVARTLERLADLRSLAGVRIAAVGEATARALAARGIVADLVPERFVAESLVEVFPEAPSEGGRVLLSVAEGARDTVASGLAAKGWDVTRVDAYRTVALELDRASADRVRAADAVTFTSSSTVSNLVAAVGPAGVPPLVASIGPVTSATARSLGLTVTVEASPHTVEGLVDALVGALGVRPG